MLKSIRTIFLTVQKIIGAAAIMCASDLLATGVITEITRHGLRIPEDISVIGFDDLPIASR